MARICLALSLLILVLATVAVSSSQEDVSVKDVRDVRKEREKIPMWTDIGLHDEKDWEDLDYKLSFLMDTYDIVSLEKCLKKGRFDHNTVREAIPVKEQMSFP